MVKLIKADLRKDRTVLVIFLLIMMLSTLLMHTGLMASDYKNVYDRHAEATGLADYVLVSSSDCDTVQDFLSQKAYVKESSSSEAVLIQSLELDSAKFSKKRNAADWIFQSTEGASDFSHLYFIERDDSVPGNKLYLNLYSAYSSGLCVGDRVTVSSDVYQQEFTIAGIFQHQFLGNSYTYLSAMVEPEVFADLRQVQEEFYQQPDARTIRTVTYVDVGEDCDVEECVKDSKAGLSERVVFCDGISANEQREYAYTAVVNILAAFIGAFAVIIMAICLIIIVFTINNNISRDVANIGALKAVGFTVGQIRGALTGEYLILGAAGSFMGIVLSYALYPALEYLYIREITGLVWEKRFMPSASFGVLLGVMAVILVTAFLSTMRIRKLHPATALRFGLQSNSFRKNHLPLSETRGKLDLLLALKSALQNKAQNLIIFVIVLAVAFVTMFSGVLYYNTKVDISHFQRIVQGDVGDAYFYVKDTSAEAVDETMAKLRTIEGVSQVYSMSSVTGIIGGEEVNFIYVTDPDPIDCGLFEGEMMAEDNEAVLGLPVAERMGVGVGDEVEVSFGERSVRFLVTGLQQSVMNERIYVTQEAALRAGVPANYRMIRVRLRKPDNESVDRVLEQGRELCGDQIVNTENQFKYQHSDENTPVLAIGFVVAFLVVLNIATMILVIRLLLKTVFVKREREFGIKKAVGFTSSQLRYQLALSLIPTALIASAAGALAGYFLVNPLFGLVLHGYGIKNSDLIVKASLMVIPVVAITSMIFLLCYLMSGRMKRLSAYGLIQE